ncbi:phytanoyl-CoA dioxygenase [Niveispirillum lacus]|uniref:Phytanoyl-CoA dioxygenase n=1 Tax=Niveispirillum lacus TaxID=1981099 RepID=A0A255YX55_9PROT|nr:phytanoyl-CoA dioxygenase family protein [Niveispirillum lacus]OYQ33792.1 phytanoyl-CoA dioxygenase [Niveispirillum lacus]
MTIGAAHLPGLVSAESTQRLCNNLAPVPLDRPGLRLRGSAEIMQFLGPDSALGRVASGLLGAGSMPVRALLFDKSPETNWSVGWHQDRVIAVRERREVPGFGPWSVKDGIHHVAPPVSVLNSMVTIRLHLDPVGPDNAPLLYAPGTHRQGVISVAEVPAVVARQGVKVSLAAAGDVWVYATLILHASAVATVPTRRRVLHVDYAAGHLPDGLTWLGL